MVDTNALKQKAAAKAVKFVESGMMVGLGTGSTTRFAIDLLGQKLQRGELTGIVAVPTSVATENQAHALGIPLADLADFDRLDIAIDGADEVTPDLQLTKGWGGALVREKLVEMQANRLVIIVDEGKLVDKLGTRGPIPVEVTPFAWPMQADWLARELGCEVSARMAGDALYQTDNHNVILHCSFAGGLTNPHAFHKMLAGRTGVVGHGLFLDMATDVIVTSAAEIKHLRR